MFNVVQLISIKKPLDSLYHSYEMFDLDLLHEGECNSRFNFNKRNLYSPCDVFEILEEIRCYNRMVSNKEEAPCQGLD